MGIAFVLKHIDKCCIAIAITRNGVVKDATDNHGDKHAGGE